MDESLSPISVSHGIPHSAPRVRLGAPTSRSQPTLIRGAGLIACLDSLAAVAGIVAVLVSVNFSNLPGGVDSFLSARITVKNVLLLILLATAWPLVFHLFGLYEARIVRSLRIRGRSSDGRHNRWIRTGACLPVDEPDWKRDGLAHAVFLAGAAHPLFTGANRQASRRSCAPSPLAPSPDCWQWSSGSTRLQRSRKLTDRIDTKWSASWTIRPMVSRQTTIPSR